MEKEEEEEEDLLGDVYVDGVVGFRLSFIEYSVFSI